jgi:hypothetical protein
LPHPARDGCNGLHEPVPAKSEEGEVVRHIYYCCDGRHVYALGVFAAFYAKDIGPALRILPYQKIHRFETFPPGAYIFTDFDRLSQASRERLGQQVDDFEANGWLVLNHPERSMGRFDLLRALYENGLNAFNVYRLADWREARRFPMFIRKERGHDQLLPDLLPDAHALEREIGKLKAEEAIASELMIVEFGNVPDADGRFRKYSAYRVGNEIYGQHCFSARNWWIKYAGNDFGQEQYDEHLRYVAENPHRDQLRHIFDVAGIDYGRIDYCVVDGGVQTFEINTNPTVLQVAAAQDGDMSDYVRLHEDALKVLLDRVPPTKDLPNRMFDGGPPLLADEVGIERIEFTRRTWPHAAPPVAASSEGGSA